MRPAILCIAALAALGSPAIDLAGKWEATYAGPRGYDPNWPKPLHTDIPTTLTLSITGTEINGTATVDYWPGLSDIRDGKIEGDRFSFTLDGRSPWRSTYQGVETIGYPKMFVEGTIQGDEMTYTMTWGDFQAKMKGRRVIE